jgi:hypothetical protein
LVDEATSGLRDAAVRIVQRYFLEPGAAVGDVVERAGAVVVDVPPVARKFARVLRKGALTPGDGYRLFEAAEDVDADPPPAPDGFAEVGGELFHLNDPAELRRFWAVVPAIEPLELAALVVEYQRSGDREHLIRDEHDAGPFLTPDEVRAVDGFTGPVVSESGDGFLVEVCTEAVAGEPGRSPGVAMRRWTIRAERGGALEWTSSLIAPHVESRFFSG